ncbi:YcaO-like family protein [Vibrio parahaemolyticus]|uniref:YcaO-like family protein n=1 Tax=Vibrio parahaemolyticus TaxID=670 RepID=UPI0011ED46C0|nr:YcaO-like family protein [Vibrio parahaemolyticus]KAB5597577.1 hypothetical protein F0578_21515 [Vibrio parahaemolyticus]
MNNQSFNMSTGFRSLDPESTLKKITPRLSDYGITRLANVTLLDFIGLPVWQAIRPLSRNLSVSQGKGSSNTQAKLSAIFEAIEMHLAEEPAVDLFEKPLDIENVCGYKLASLPNQIHSPPVSKRRWTKASFLFSNEETYLPTDLIELDFTKIKLGEPWFRANSTGLATGGTKLEAILYGLYEIIERDCLVNGDSYVPLCNTALSYLDDQTLSIIEILNKNKISVSTEIYTNRFSVPVYKVLISSGDNITFYGTCARLNHSKAFCGALFEAIQSRLTLITGSREDIKSQDYSPKIKTINYRKHTHYKTTFMENDKYQSLIDEYNQIILKLSELSLEPIILPLGELIGVYNTCFTIVPGLRGPNG